MGRLKKWRILSAANARAAKKVKMALPFSPNEDDTLEIDLTGIPSDSDETRWPGGVNHDPETDNSDFSWDEGSESESEDDVTDDEDPELIARLQKNVEHHLQLLDTVTAYDALMTGSNMADWKKVESKRALGYTGNSARTARRHDKWARDKEKEDAKVRKT